MKLLVNANTLSFDVKPNILSIISHYNLNPDKIIVLVNQEIIVKNSYSSFEPSDGSTIDILSIVGGG